MAWQSDCVRVATLHCCTPITGGLQLLKFELCIQLIVCVLLVCCTLCVRQSAETHLLDSKQRRHVATPECAASEHPSAFEHNLNMVGSDMV